MLPDGAKLSTSLALALLEGGEQATQAELDAVAGERDAPLKVINARALRKRADDIIDERFGGRGSMPEAEQGKHGFGLVAHGGEITGVVFSEGDALRLLRSTDLRMVHVLVRQVAAPQAVEAMAEAAAADARRKLEAALRDLAPGQSLTLPLPAAPPTERRATQQQITNVATRLWGSIFLQMASQGNTIVVTRLAKPARRAASASPRSAPRRAA